MKTGNDAISGCLGVILGTVLIIVLSSLVGGYTLSVLWEWFIVTTFGLTPLNIWQAIGVSSVVSFLTHEASSQDTSKYSSYGEWLIAATATVIARSVIYLVIGGIVYSFIQGG
jgi:cadmium resistance protein CadD (predicted permease)